jgi:TRAP-type C4-dicarboxylate transport system permease small subunit
MIFTRICDAYARFLQKLMLILGLALIFAVTLQVLGRYVPFIPRFLWPLELANFTLIWLVFLGSS